ncbi:MAG: septal ring lytic transglycosylase RlpA family protein [Campylobacteraceae bacterium]|nr:septal ring lytic transglycosylase RlpA family protein [Campylobacteraceae bacterium]
MKYQWVINASIAIFTLLFLNGCTFKSSIDAAGGIKDSPQMHKAVMRPYTIAEKTYYPTQVNVGDTMSGIASWYGKDFHGKKTSNGETYDMYGITAAHKTFPMNTIVKVVNKRNNKTVIVRINDRGPFVANRIIDLSYAAAKQVGLDVSGTAPVVIEVLGFEGRGNVGSKSVVINDFDVQIGAFKNPNGARTYKDEHNRAGGRYEAFIKDGYLDGERIYRVWLRGFGSEAEARDFISKSRYQGAFIVREK